MPTLNADREYDACVIGSGAAGSVVAAELATAGWDVLVVEQGKHEAPGTHLHQLIPTFETARARDGQGRWVEHGYPWSACCVGGGTRFYAGVSLRLRTIDFDPGAHVAADAMNPAWPYGYDALNEHYEWAEQRLGVSSDNGLDPTAPASPVGAMPAQRPSVRGAALARAAASLGLHPFPMPLAVSTLDRPGMPACTDATTCTDWVCPVGAKGDAWVRLLATSAITLLTRLKAIRLIESARGRVSGVECFGLDSGSGRSVTAKVYVLAANAVQTSALLLRSASRYSPAGAGNGSGLIGSGLCMKVAQNLTGHLDEPLPARPPRAGGRYVTVAISDYYYDAGGPGLGGLIYETGPLDPELLADARVMRLEVLLADQPLARNQVRLDRGSPDKLGLPRLVMDYRPHPLDLRRLAALRERGADLLRAAGAGRIVAEPPDFTLGSAHLHGTCRMGADPATSVCAPDGRMHEADNVFIADGSLFPYPGGVNPTLTIQAVARKVARAIMAEHHLGR